MVNTNKPVSYTGHTIHFGLDYHKKSWRVHPVHGSVSGKGYTIVNPTVEELNRRLNKTYPGATFIGVYEAGFSGYELARKLKAYDIKMSPIHAADVPVTDKDRQQKTDAVDALRLAQLARSGEYEAIYIPTLAEEFFRQLVRRRTDLVKSTSRMQVKIKSHLAFTGRLPDEMRVADWKLNGKVVAMLEELARTPREDVAYDDYVLLGQLAELKDCRKRVLESTRQARKVVREQHGKLYDLLIGCPGIGPVTAMTLIAELFNLDRFANFDKLCSYVGLMPRTKSSGEKEYRGQMVSRGNKRLRTALIEASWQAKRNDSALELYYYELKMEAKLVSNMAIVKVARKLLSRIRRVWITGEPYQTGIN